VRHVAFTLALLASLFCASAASLAEAQQPYRLAGPEGQPTEADIQRARDLFVSGTEDADLGRWADALGKFAEAYRLSGIGAALYNAATTLRSLGRYREARDAFDQLLEQHADDLDDEMRLSARELRVEVAGRVARLDVLDLPEAPDLRLRLDGARLTDDGSRPLSLETDPGRHALRVELPQHEPYLWEGSLGDGERQVVRVVLTEIEVETGATVRNAVLGTLAAALVVAGAIVAVVLLTGDEGLQPESDNVVRL